MSLPLGRQDLVGNLVDRANDLGLASTIGNTASITSSDITCDKAKTCILLVSATSGTYTVKVSVHSGTADFTSPDATLTGAADTTIHALTFNTTASKLKFGVKATEAGGGMGTVAGLKMSVLVLDKLGAYEDFVCVSAGSNATASAVVGDGSGAFTALA